MKTITLLAVLAVSMPAFASDVDLVPYGFVSQVMRETKAAAAEAKAGPDGRGALSLSSRDTQESRSRAQVVAATQEAARLGLLHSGEAGPVQATPAQEAQIQAAGERAVRIDAAAR